MGVEHPLDIAPTDLEVNLDLRTGPREEAELLKRRLSEVRTGHWNCQANQRDGRSRVVLEEPGRRSGRSTQSHGRGQDCASIDEGKVCS